MNLFCREWWAYLLEKPKQRGYKFSNRWLDRLNVIFCRAQGHPNGVIWYNPGGSEPDTTCKDCGDNLG